MDYISGRGSGSGRRAGIRNSEVLIRVIILLRTGAKGNGKLAYLYSVLAPVTYSRGTSDNRGSVSKAITAMEFSLVPFHGDGCTLCREDRLYDAT